MSDRIKHIVAYIAEAAGKAAINEEARTIRFVISSGAIDRDNEIVEPSAIAAAIREFSKNPVCLACHQHTLSDGMPPVVGSWDTESFKASEKRCEMDLRFADTELAETYWTLYKGKHMRAVSIGFRVLDGHEVIESGKRYFVITKIELYEISCVPVGSNRDALSKLKAVGDWQPDADDKSALPAAVKAFLDDKFKATESRLAAMESLLEEIKDLHIPDADRDLSMPDAEDDPDGADEKNGHIKLDTLTKTLKTFF